VYYAVNKVEKIKGVAPLYYLIFLYSSSSLSDSLAVTSAVLPRIMVRIFVVVDAA